MGMGWMIDVRLDDRIVARVDPSDEVQDTMIEANRRLPDYLKNRPLPFYPWLRQIASERLAKLHRRHIYTQKRSVEREDEDGVMLNDRSSLLPADNFSTARSSPSNRLLRKEIRPHVKSAFGRLRGTDQEILVMRHLEQLSIREIASVLDITVTAAKSRHFPALERLRSALGDDFSEEQR
ncbi:MAG: sigma-70 family RNA polymerase sigma factor [Planctomycetes bacterium]|nr:sigma-70 family RNA polymerase sigma factor [Planctomycetota bacterium]